MSVNAPVNKNITIEKMEKALGLDKVAPIILTSSEADSDFTKDQEYFKDMYEDELRKTFKKTCQVKAN